MRILIVATVSTTVKAFLLPYADYFRKLGWAVDGLAHGIDECGVCAGHFDHVYGIDWSRRPLDPRNVTGAIRRVRALVAKEGYDIVHVHTPVAAFITRLALSWGRREGRPSVIYTAHGFHFQPGNNRLHNLVFAGLEKVAGRFTDFLITMNQTDKQAAIRLGLVPPDRLRYMPGIGIDFQFFRPLSGQIPDAEDPRRRFDIPDEAPIFVMVAEFIPRKRHEDAVKALCRMEKGNAHLILVGTGPRRKKIEKLAAAAGVRARVHFAGQQEDVRPFIQAARALVLCSAQEGLPRSVMEALSCGVPVAGSDVRGTRDLIAGGGGLLFPVGNVQELAFRLDYFANHPKEALEMGAAGRRGLERHDIASLLEMHEELYLAAARHPHQQSPCLGQMQA